MKLFAFSAIFLFCNTLFSQIKGTITDKNAVPIPFVNIYIENSSVGTTSNEKGEYTLPTKEQNVVIIFQSLGFKIEKKQINTKNFPHTLNITLSEESYILDEVVVTNKENPANAIIRNAIQHKKQNSEITNRFEADFYSKGVFKIKDMPKKILGKDVGDLDGMIDSISRSGIIYQSETISKVKFEKPNNVKEYILASKVAGNSNGFSFNTATEANFDFYDNYLTFDVKAISPIANNAFNYYTFQLENTFYDDHKHLINKIKVSPKRDKEPVFEGYIYIVENSWAIYGLELNIKGYRMQNPAIKELNIVQNFNFNKLHNIWNKKLQTINVNVHFLMIKLQGNFSYVYNNYIFKENFEKKEFKGEFRSFANNANKKDSLFWASQRQIPLTLEEKLNYTKKDSIEKVRTSDQYLDSIDTRRNRFKISDFLFGYSYRKSKERKYFNYKGLFDLSSLSFNTVQGFTIGTGASYNKYNKEKNSSTEISTDFQYGFAEKKLRIKGWFKHTFNQIHYPFLEISGGTNTAQFNSGNPISPLVNDISTLFFKSNFMKLYHNDFLKVGYGQDLTKDIFLRGDFSFSNRKPLWNNTDYTFIQQDKIYTSNNPLLPYDYEENFKAHYIAKLSMSATFYFNRKYMSYPNYRVNISDPRYPKINLQLTNAFRASEKSLQYQHIAGNFIYNPSFDNKGDMHINLSAGTFWNAENINFIDYKHFNGNQTHFSSHNNNNAFNLLPYYTHSTNKSYFEAHIQHHFRGFISNKIPLFNKLQWNFVVGFHHLSRKNARPYQEISFGLENIGWGSFRFLRVDYVRGYGQEFNNHGVMFGLFIPLGIE